MSHHTITAAEIAYLVARCRSVLDAIGAAEPDFGDAAQIRGITEAAAAKGDIARSVRSAEIFST